ncbi:MAG TPA: hypothetical protein VN408_43665 [Actinoplanes sp.]|nr:hypothetical protein [Actinoplanes sp.]
MKVLDAPSEQLIASHRVLRSDDLILTSIRQADGTITIKVGRRGEDGSWQWSDE